MQNRKEQEELLGQQVLEIMQEEQQEPRQREEFSEQGGGPKRKGKSKKSRRKKRALKTVTVIMVLLLVCMGLVLGTKAGRSVIYRAAGNFVYQNMDNTEGEEDETSDIQHMPGARHEDYVTNYLIFGIEKFGGARNTDSMMIASINTKDNTVKLTSLLRDSYVDIPDHKPNKLNSAYAKGGAALLIQTIETNYKIQIDGYASVDFESFEEIVDMLGGVTIELGKEEAAYLNKTNYISKKANRNVHAGVNKLNGNQAMGYCRVRKVKTLGGANSDYGRIVRQQRVLKAMFDSYVAPRNMLQLLPITKKGLGYVTTNLSQKQIERAMEAVVENRITKMETSRIPVDGAFDAPKKANGIGYPLILNWQKNRVALYQFVFGDTKEEAEAKLAALEK
ncbi:LCP family protein required for cell wall assembly [Anaerotaenia torta]|uniref:LCP family protein n=1 Tax=Anaerotaenia torta TaxID=433293 RepID=UPI003D262B34